ncbi:hypothetical protein INQ41_05845 [Lysobacter ciconiae]|uniref:Uncharacterized protein n=1 Tax=Novilysobacter ciconiae TaxID=2781022 RepID=A0A7S6UHQ3_9GAMM|nr:hypothetical protein [Lysobacter ciconiae]QOW20533.1 hypothetical protein INQ41_05845 [Lysobacter ciconiae]
MNETTTPPPRQGHLVSTTAMLITAGVFIVIAGVLYYVGLSQGRKELATQKVHYEQQIEQGNQTLGAAKADLAKVQNRNYLMRARVDLYRTAVDLDQRNFGIANTRLHEAADSLGQIQKDAGGIDLGGVAKLKDAIESNDFTVAADLEGQRANVLDFAAQLDAIAADAELDVK